VDLVALLQEKSDQSVQEYTTEFRKMAIMLGIQRAQIYS